MDSKDDEIVSAPLEENDQRPPEVFYPVTVLYSTTLLSTTFSNVTNVYFIFAQDEIQTADVPQAPTPINIPAVPKPKPKKGLKKHKKDLLGLK